MATTSGTTPASGHITIVLIERAWVETMNLGPALELLRPMVASRAAAEHCAGTLKLMFLQYDDDPAELWEIGQVRRWFQALTQEFPYWFVFSERDGSELAFVFNLLLGPGTPTTVAGGAVAARVYNPSDFDAVLGRLFHAMKTLCGRLDIPAATRSRWEEDVCKAIMAGTELR